MFWRKRKQSDFNSEIEAHLDIEADELAEDGAHPGDAKHRARQVFGNVTASEERFYESGRWVWLEQFAQDLRYGLRILRRNPGIHFHRSTFARARHRREYRGFQSG